MFHGGGLEHRLGGSGGKIFSIFVQNRNRIVNTKMNEV